MSGLRVLLVDDNPDDRALVARELSREWPDAEIVEAIDGGELDVALLGPSPDLVLTDYQLHDTDGLDVLRRARSAWPDCCVLMLTDSGSEDVAVQAMKEGCADYVLKRHLQLLVPSARSALEADAARGELASAQIRLREIFDELPVGVWRATLDGRLEDANPAFLRLHGFTSVEEARGADMVRRYVNPDDRDLWRRLADDGDSRAVTLRVRRGDGEEFYGRIAARAVRDERADVVAYEGTMEDVTAEVEAIAAARAAEARFTALVEAPTLMVWIGGPDLRPSYYSAAWLAFRGRTHEEECARDTWDPVHPEDREEARASFERAVASQGAITYQYRLQNAEGEYRTVIDASVPFYASDGGFGGYFAIVTDVTERHRLEEQLSRALRLEAVGRLAGGIAHDFNNLLTVIGGYARLIAQDLAGGHRHEEAIGEVLAATERASSLTNRLLLFARGQAVERGPVELNGLVDSVRRLVDALVGEEIELRVNLAPTNVWVSGDVSQLDQIVMNLVLNARDAMPAGGGIEIATSVRNGEAVLSVADTGSGMDETTRERIFEPLFTTKDVGQGTGLGLATVHAAVADAGGYIRVESAPGQGSRFDLVFPRVATPEEPVAAIVPPTVARSPARILLVEDEPLLRELSRAVLAAVGHAVTACEGGESALREFAREAAGFDLVLSDVRLPGISGVELVRRLRQDQPMLRALLVSGFTEERATISDPFLAKPWSKDDLLRAVEEALESV
jgi:two-component system cell cycle sensor histidine kinase/response regulator CckA